MKMEWAGNVARIQMMRIAYIILVGKAESKETARKT